MRRPSGTLFDAAGYGRERVHHGVNPEIGHELNRPNAGPALLFSSCPKTGLTPWVDTSWA